MKKLIETAMVLLIVLALTGCGNTDYEQALYDEINANWNIELAGGYEVIYRKTNRGGFHGDGLTFTVIEYPGGIGNELFAWDEAGMHSLKTLGSIECFYDTLDVAEEFRKDFSGYETFRILDGDMPFADDELLILHYPDAQRLYIIESYT